MKTSIRGLLLSTLITVSSAAIGQTVVPVGGGSYASYAPLSTAKTDEHAGDQSQFMQYRPLWVTERENQPLPTNDWWTNCMVQQYSGRLWAYPTLIETSSQGITVHTPSYWIDNGTEMKSRSQLLVSGKRFTPEGTVCDSWHDWDLELLMKQGDKRMLCTLMHGSPFTWIECENLSLTLSKREGDSFTVNADNEGKGNFCITIGNDVYGVYLPTTASWKNNNNEISVDFNNGPQYIVIGLIKNVANLNRFADYAYNIPRDTRVSYEYDESKGIVKTYWNTTADHLASAASASKKVLSGFLPHHYREVQPQFGFTDITYATPRGEMKMAEGADFEIDYSFPGMLPFYAMPEDEGFDKERMLWMLNQYATQGGFGSDTYWGGKGLTQMALNMMFAREMGDEELFETCRSRLRSTLENWYTYTPGEEGFYFNYVPRWGGLVGQHTSYDSDTFNDHHFHYGYFTYASALLAMVDDDFREKYSGMMKLVAKDYANWDREDTRFPWMRCLDPWAGHSFAGGLGDGGGNGQESSSEAMQGWGGLYLLGVALGDKDMRDAGLFGYVQEARGVAEYWFDRSRQNIDYEKFQHPYNSNLTCHGVGWWTYFSGDPVWMHAIQWMPVSPCLDYLSEDKAFAAWDYQTMWESKEITGWDGELADASLGNVLLSYLQRSNPEEAARIFDQLWNAGKGVAKDVDTGGITYFVTHSHLTYGDLDFTTYASIPTARAFIKDGEYTYMAYNPKDEPQEVVFYRDGAEVFRMMCAPRQLTVSGHESKALTTVIPVTETEVDPLEGLSMQNIALGKNCSVSSYENVGTQPSSITDGDDNTRWGSKHNDGEWVIVDLGEIAALHHLRLHWEAAYPSQYKIETFTGSTPGMTEKIINSDGGWDEIDMDNIEARFIKITSMKRATTYGISLYEVEAYGRMLSLGDDELLGVKITADDDVLTQYKATPLHAKGYTCGGEWVEVTPQWSTEDGAITADGLFTPYIYNKATVKASFGSGPRASVSLPVEEALRVTSLSVSPSSVQLIEGQSLHVSAVTTNQFGGPINPKDIEWTVDKEGASLTIDDDGVTFTTEQSADYTLTATIGELSASMMISVRPITEVNLARGKHVECSGYENGGTLPQNAVDGDADTRWGSLHKDNQWLTVDLGGEYDINKVRILWEAAYADSYRMEASIDGEDWTTLYEVANCKGGTDEHLFAETRARYMRFYGLKRHTQYGFSLFEMEVYGTRYYDETAGIVNSRIAIDKDGMYDLMGRKLPDGQVNPNTLFIKDGKKFLSK